MAQKAGELIITGKAEDSEIDAAFDQWERDFADLENQTNQVNVSMKKMTDTTDALAKHLFTIATVGVGGVTALATKSPALAGIFAQIELSTMKLANTVGRQVRPIFEGVNSLIRDFDQALIEGDQGVQRFTTSLGENIGDIGSVITGQWSEIDNLIPKSAGAIAGIKFGAKFGLHGMILGAVLGAVAGDLAVSEEEEIPEAIKEELGPFARSGAVLEETRQKGTDIALSDMGFIEEGLAYGGLATSGIARFAINIINDIIRLGSSDSTESKLSSADGVPREGDV